MKTNVFKEDIRVVVNMEEWQILRKSLVGTWKHKSAENVLKLRVFGGDLTDPRRVRILLNYLTGSGFRIGVIDSAEIREFRDIVRCQYKKLKSQL